MIESMDWFSLSNAVALLSTWGYVILFPLAVVEGPIIGIVAGFLISLGQMSWLGVFLVLFVGDIVGDVAYYYIGRWGHGPWAERLAARFGATQEKQERFKEAFNKNDVKILLINKTQALGSITLYYAGALRMPMLRFLWINAVGTAPKVLLFEVVGYFFGQSYMQISKYLNYIGFATLLIPVALIAAYLLFKRYGKRSNDKDLVA